MKLNEPFEFTSFLNEQDSSLTLFISRNLYHSVFAATDIPVYWMMKGEIEEPIIQCCKRKESEYLAKFIFK
jgi:hypothetical protein